MAASSSSSSSSASSAIATTLHRADTLSVSIAAPPQRVFDFVRRAENLSRWNTSAFCLAGEVHHLPHQLQDTREKRYHHRAETPYGPIRFTVASHEELGVVDRHIMWGDSERQAPGEEGRELIMPSRVVPNGGGSEFLITIFHPPAFLKQERGRDFLPHDEWLSLWKTDLYLLKSILENDAPPSTTSASQRA